MLTLMGFMYIKLRCRCLNCSKTENIGESYNHLSNTEIYFSDFVNITLLGIHPKDINVQRKVKLLQL